jgi:hypothetical protein
MKIFLGNFNAKVGTEDILKQIVQNEDLYEISNDNGLKKKKKTPWPLVRERTISTDRPPLVDEI